MELVHLVGFITKKFVTMRGHMNVKLLFHDTRGGENNGRVLQEIESNSYLK